MGEKGSQGGREEGVGVEHVIAGGFEGLIAEFVVRFQPISHRPLMLHQLQPRLLPILILDLRREVVYAGHLEGFYDF